MMRQIITAVRLLRPQSVFLMCLFLALPIGMRYQSAMYSTVQVLPIFLLLCGEIALNDVCDIEKDRFNKPQRPLVSGELNLNSALVLAVSVITCSVVVGILTFYQSAWRLIIFGGLLIILSFYNYPWKFMPLIKTFITAGATVLALSLLLTYQCLPYPQFTLGCAFFFILGREMLMDIRDYSGDLNNSYQTLAIRIGKRKTFCFSTICFCLSILLCVLIPLSKVTPLYIAGAVLFSLTTIVLVMLFSKVDDKKRQNRIALLFWLPMLALLMMLY